MPVLACQTKARDGTNVESPTTLGLIIDAAGMALGDTDCGHGEVEVPHTRVCLPAKSVGPASSLAVSDNLAQIVDAVCVFA